MDSLLSFCVSPVENHSMLLYGFLICKYVTFNLEIFSHLEEAVKMLLGNTDLPMVHELQDSLHVLHLDTPQVQQHLAARQTPLLAPA